MSYPLNVWFACRWDKHLPFYLVVEKNCSEGGAQGCILLLLEEWDFCFLLYLSWCFWSHQRAAVQSARPAPPHRGAQGPSEGGRALLGRLCVLAVRTQSEQALEAPATWQLAHGLSEQKGCRTRSHWVFYSWNDFGQLNYLLGDSFFPFVRCR